MPAAAKPKNELARLNALLSYDVLDTPDQSAFDELTALASQICETPISLVSMIDKDRQWFKSVIGLDVKETHRDHAFCAYAIHKTEILEVEDAQKDERFKDNPLVLDDPNIRFYAGMPLETPDGYNIGTLCVIDTKPRKLTRLQRNTLEVLGHQVIKQMELSRYIKQTNHFRKMAELTSDLVFMTDLQGFIFLTNPACETTLDIRKEILERMPILEIMNQSHKSDFLTMLNRIGLDSTVDFEMTSGLLDASNQLIEGRMKIMVDQAESILYIRFSKNV